MNKSPLTIVKSRTIGFVAEFCFGNIPDIYRSLYFNQHTEHELPDAKCSDQEFQDWLSLYRHSSNWFEYQLLEESQCG